MNIKRIIVCVLSTAILSFGVPFQPFSISDNEIIVSASDAESTYGVLIYKEFNDYIIITGCSENVTSVKIPEFINDKPVTQIGGSAFDGLSSLTEVEFSSNLKKIGHHAFAETGLLSVTIPENVDYLDAFAFSYCKNLKSAYILNPNCHIDNFIPHLHQPTFDSSTNIYGYAGSTAETYVKNHGHNNFILLSSLVTEITTTTTTEITTTTTTTTTGYTGYGRINPKEDTYSFKNFKAIIPLDYYRKYLGNSCGFSLWERLQGGVTSNGVCAGMVTTAISTNAYDIPSLKASSINSYAGGCSYSCLYDVEDWVSKDEIMDAHVYQYTPYFSNQKKAHINRLDELYDVVKNYCEGGEAVYISIRGDISNKKDCGHALLALGIKENNSEYTSIAVYDCNYPYGFSNLLTGDRLLYLYKSNGVYTGWEYDFTNNIKWGSNYPNGIISYVTPGYGYANGITKASNWVDKYNTLISVKTDTEINASNELVPIVDCNVCLDENGQIIANEYENDLYWVNGDNLSISSKNEPLDITISSYENRIVASVPENAEISINNDNDRINKVQISSDDNQNIELSYQIVNDDNEVIPINIIAESTDNLQASLNGNELQVISDGNVEVSGKENTINKQIEDESIVIDLSDDLSEVISQYKIGDTNKDGSFGISDLVRLQNWLLNPDVNNVTLGTSDLNNDGIIDAFDMVLLRKKFVDSFIVPEVKINNDLVNLYKGETSQIIAEVKPKDSIIKWSTSDSSVATVSSNGLITAKSVGSTKITATITYKGLTYSDSVNVNVLPVGISFDETEKNVYIGDKFYINNSVNPEAEITWISNNPNVASVDSSGCVTANSVGSARIMGKINLSGHTYSATCRVTVKKINLNFDVSSKTVNVGEGFYLDKNASDNQRIIWTSSNPGVAYVNSRGYVIPISAGTSVVKGEITVFGYTYSDTCTIIVER